ncbi:MAG TPA: uracil-DNA glycosylase family protein [Gaiellaceae bacterium]|nr:uracil-DNA glycosylase family protein [Gaiellaceae bacterium]
MTRRRTRYRSLSSLQRDNAVCRACAEAGYPLASLPVFEGRPGQRAFIVGQAPGMVEGEERRPWRGRAGRTLRRWLGMEEDEFYATFYCASVTRCYPGRLPGARGDRRATPLEVELCRFWLDWDLRLLRPAVIVPVGGLAIERLLGRTGLRECVGCRFELDEAVAVPLPHPSGASGWLNERANRDRLALALEVLSAELSRAGAGAAAARTRTT